ncbi:MAG TPA: hypothetical protein VFE69_07295, partial [Ilumatobacteraceae bacterium]|nr:hypothetical protein [Ilumatobacteraceae bacterium]
MRITMSQLALYGLSMVELTIAAVSSTQPPAVIQLRWGCGERKKLSDGWLDKIDEDLFERWEAWFIDVEESHTSQPSLSFFRSPHPQRSWITAG